MATAAEIRERRKMKILMGSEERMKKLMGMSKEPSNLDHHLPATTVHSACNSRSDENIDCPDGNEQLSHVHCYRTPPNSLKRRSKGSSQEFPVSVECSPRNVDDRFVNRENYDDLPIEESGRGSTDSSRSSSPSTFDLTDQPRSTDHVAQQSTDDVAQRSKDFVAQRSTEESRVDESKVASRNTAYYRWRTVLMLVSGVVVRLAFLGCVGPKFVESVFNPFVAVEVALYGYQRATHLVLDDGADSGALWLMALQLSGIDPHIISSYRCILGRVTLVFNDFAVYFFAFVVTHIIV